MEVAGNAVKLASAPDCTDGPWGLLRIAQA
jgi:hypothetical protein